MADFNWKKATTDQPSIILRNDDGCVVLASFVTGSDTVMLTLPLSCLQDFAVIVRPTDELDLADKTLTYSETGDVKTGE